MAAVAAAVVVAGCESQASGPAAARDHPARFAQWGEGIYFTGRDTRGREIPFSEGSIAVRLRGGACVDCHGADRRGGRRMVPRFWTVAPDITPPALFAPERGAEAGPRRRPPYDFQSLRRAIRDGVDPSGRSLDPAMPRWSLSDRDLSELVYYLSR